MKINFLKKFNQNQNMTKRNLIFGMLLISVLMTSLVSAGITGYLTRGDLVPGTSAQIESVGLNSVVVDGEKVETGGIFTRGSTTYKVVAVEKPSWFLGRPKVAIQEVAPPVVVSQTATDCEENCQAFTEMYKLKEGQVISIAGDTISIDFINANQVMLDVNYGQITPLLNEGNTFELSDGRIVIVDNVHRLEVGGEIGWVDLGVTSSYNLEEGQVISIQGNSISIDFIDADSTALSVNGIITSDMPEGQTFEFSNGQIAFVEDVRKLEVAGEIGHVIIGLASCYFIN